MIEVDALLLELSDVKDVVFINLKSSKKKREGLQIKEIKGEYNMTKDELKNIIYLDERINSKLRQLDNLKEMRGSISAIDYTKDNVQCSPTNQLENSVIKIIELENEIDNDIDKLVDKKNEARILINSLEGIEGTVLEMRYLECMKWEEVAYRLNYSIQAIYKIHGQALQYIKRVE